MTDQQRAAALRRFADMIEAETVGLSENSETVLDIRAGAAAIERLAQVYEIATKALANQQVCDTGTLVEICTVIEEGK